MKAFLLTVVFVNMFSFAQTAIASDEQSLVVKNLETCFSPEGNCDQKLIGVINSAKKTLDIAIFSITHPDIATAITAAKERGIVVRMVVDKSQSEGGRSETGNLIKANVPLKIGNVEGIMHDKYTVVDGVILETGSFNYTASATSYNSENQIYITDSAVIKKYQDNFEKLWNGGLAAKN